jgi:hypothetical protein
MLWLFTIPALAYAFAGGLFKTRDDTRHQGTDGGASSGSHVSFHLDTTSPREVRNHGV